MCPDKRGKSNDDAHAVDEWRQISMQIESEVLERGQKWLKKHGLGPAAGQVLQRLLRIRPYVRFISQAKSWLEKYSSHPDASDLLAELLRHDSSTDLVKMAQRYLQEAEERYFIANDRSCYRFGPSSLMRELLRHHRRSKCVSLIEQYVRKNPGNEIWTLVFPVSTYDIPNFRVERLTAQWVALNVENANLFLASLPVLTPSVEVSNACFAWVRKGGMHSEYMPRVLADILMSQLRNCGYIFRDVVDFTRRWLKANHCHEEAGKIYGRLTLATNLPMDIEGALDWYVEHTNNHSAKFVIADLLELAYLTATQASPYVVREAKRLLRHKESRDFPYLIGALVSVVPDFESIMWAKDVFIRLKLHWILIRLLHSAPDEESIAMANETFNDWINSSIESEMLVALLKADPMNKRIRRRAFFWLKKHPQDVYCAAIKELLQRR